MIFFGDLYHANTSLTYICTTSFAEISFMHAIKYPHFINLSIITSIALYNYPVIRSFDFGNLIIKFYNITSYSLFGVLTG